MSQENIKHSHNDRLTVSSLKLIHAKLRLNSLNELHDRLRLQKKDILQGEHPVYTHTCQLCFLIFSFQPRNFDSMTKVVVEVNEGIELSNDKNKSPFF